MQDNLISSYKCCSSCNVEKSRFNFSASAAYSDGYRGQCKQCRSGLKKKYKRRTVYNDPVGSKICSGCRQTKPIAEFGFHTSGADGRRRRCRSCHSLQKKERAKTYIRPSLTPQTRLVSRNRLLRKNYGIDHNGYLDILSSQGGRCALCTFEPRKEALCVDHCHTIGRVRGLLCRRCNRGVAHFGDNEAGIRKVLLYVSAPVK